MVKYRLCRCEIISDEMVKHFPCGEMLRGCAAIIGVRIWGVFIVSVGLVLNVKFAQVCEIQRLP